MGPSIQAHETLYPGSTFQSAALIPTNAMASNILSNFLPPAVGEPSIYETLRQHDDASDKYEVQDRGGIAIDEENLGERFRDSDLDAGDAATQSVIGLSSPQKPRYSMPNQLTQSTKASKKKEMDDIDDEVPPSLLIEDDRDLTANRQTPEEASMPPPVPGPSSRTSRAKWQATQRQQRLHSIPSPPQLQRGLPVRGGRSLGLTNPRERATWMWANVENLDKFLNEVYEYYTGHGIWSILLSRMIRLL